MCAPGVNSLVQTARFSVIDLGRMPYAEAYAEQQRHHAEILASREATSDELGRILTVEHPPVITITKRPGAADHLLASPGLLRRAGVELAETDRGGDITYHGPGQLVVYPIIDLNRVGLRLHPYMRLLEQAVIDTLAGYGIEAVRDEEATGVWTRRGGRPHAKLCAMGVRVRRWVSLHGLALNITTNLDHFGLIVPCGLAGRPVTSIERERAGDSPSWADVRDRLTTRLIDLLESSAARVRTGGDG